jgi:hypothetical protein
LQVRNVIAGRYDSFNSPVKQAVLKADLAIPLFPGTGAQWKASARFYFLEYFGLDPDCPSRDKSLRWSSLCQQQIECCKFKEEGTRKRALEVFRALHYYRGTTFTENIPNPLFGIEKEASEYLNLRAFFGEFHY